GFLKPARGQNPCQLLVAVPRDAHWAGSAVQIGASGAREGEMGALRQRCEDRPRGIRQAALQLHVLRRASSLRDTLQRLQERRLSAAITPDERDLAAARDREAGDIEEPLAGDREPDAGCSDAGRGGWGGGLLSRCHGLPPELPIRRRNRRRESVRRK